MKIHWLSPLFPAKTGVAHYNRHLLPELAARAEVVVFTPQESWDPEIERHVKVRPIGREDRRFWRELHEADLTVCHLGRPAAFHGAIAEVARRHASLVVLHESRLFGLLSEAVVGIRGQVERFLELCEAEAGPAGRRAASRWLRGEDMFRLEQQLPFTGLFTEGALGVVVHSASAARDVEREGEAGLPLLELPLPCPAEMVFPSAAPTGPRRLVTCGHLGSEHRLEALLEALARSPHRLGLHLDVFGELRQPDVVVRLRDRLGLQPQVTFRGFVLEHELAAALQSARLGFDLRLPSLGGASLVRLEMWRHGLAVAATPGNQASGTAAADDGLLAIREGSELADLEAALALAASSSASADAELRRLATRGRELLETYHRPAAYADALLEFAARVTLEAPRCLEQRWREQLHRLLGGSGLEKPARVALAELLARTART